MIADWAAEVAVATPSGGGATGSGFLVGPRLILTAKHVVERAGRGGSEVVVRPLRSNGKLRCRTVWTSASRDLALLEITDGTWSRRAARLGRLTTSTPEIPCEAVGFPRAQVHPDGWGDSEHLTGTINPATAVISDRHQLTAGSGAAPSGWPGMSGAAVLSAGMVIGVVVEDRAAFGGARLVVEPVSSVTGDESFARAWSRVTGSAPPELESVEFAPVFGAVSTTPPQPSPGSLLRADALAVRFRGRERELAELRDWCAGDGFSMRLVSARGGEGKTRLALQFAAELRARGWTAGTVRASAPDEALRHAVTTVEPLLLVIDYAETRGPQLACLIEVLTGYQGRHPVRLLLLARSGGEWWQRLTERFPVPAGHPLRLGPLVVAPADRTRAYRAAIGDLAQALALVPGMPSADPGPLVASAGPASPARTADPASPSAPDATMPGAQPRTQPGTQPGAHDTSVLALHAAALVALLQQGPDAVDAPRDESVWDTLLRHERRYWRRAADEHRLTLREEILDSAVTGMVLCPSADEAEARALLARVPGLHDRSHDVRLRVGSLLRHLYPGEPDSGGPWSPLQPDRLAEHFAVGVLRAEPELLTALLREASDPQLEHAFTVLGRASAHRPEAADLLSGALVEEPGLTRHAVRVVPRSEHPGALTDAVVEVIDRELLPLDELRQVADAIPPVSPALARVALEAYETLVHRYDRLLQDHPGHLPDYLHAVERYSDRLSDAGRTEEALGVYQEALEGALLLYRSGAETAFSRMITVFANYSNKLADAGHHDEALRVTREQADLFERAGADDITTADPKYLLLHLMARVKIVGFLLHSGRTDEALSEGDRLLALVRRAADAHTDLADPVLAPALAQVAVVLRAVGREEEALGLEREEVAYWERRALVAPELHLPSLAFSLRHLAEHLSEAGRTEEALVSADRAVGIWRDRLPESPVVCKPLLAKALFTHGSVLAAAGRLAAAVEAAREAAGLRRELVRLEPGTYRLPLVEALANTVQWSAAVGAPYQTALAELRTESDILRTTDPDAGEALDRILPVLEERISRGRREPTRHPDEQETAPVSDSNAPLSEQLRQQLTADPHNSALRLGLASLLAAEGRREQALAEVATVLQSAPGSAEAQRLMRQLLLDQTSVPPSPLSPPPSPPSPQSPSAPLSPPSGSGAGPSPERQPVVGPEAARRASDPPDGLLEIRREAVRLADVAGMATVKQRLELTFLGPARNLEIAKTFGHRLRGGLLLYGPPGCGKTFIARALAGELGAGFLSVTLADTLDMWMGNSERNIRSMFVTARRNRPCVLFIDEMDALGGRRTRMHFSGMRNVVAQLLTEMDSVNSDNDGVFVLGATNQPWDVDSALRRPGRLDRMLFVAPPDEPARAAIIHRALDGKPVGTVDVNQLVARTAGYSGADLVHLCQSAVESAMADSLTATGIRPIGTADFTAALREVKPSTGEWFESARSVIKFSNQDHAYDELADYLGRAGRKR